MRNYHRSGDRDILPSRPICGGIVEIAFMCAGLLAATQAAGSSLCGPGWIPFATRLGRVALEHIGWGFGIYIPMLMGFFAIIIGGQFVGTPETVARTRRSLALVAEAIAATLAPTLALVVTACIAEPELAGALFVIVPAAAATFFLAIRLGGFMAFEPAARLRSAERARDDALIRLRRLRVRSRRSMVWVLTVHAFGAAVAAELIGVALASPLSLLLMLPIVAAPLAIGLSLVAVSGQSTELSGISRVETIVVRTIPVCVGFFVLLLAAELTLTDSPAIGVTMLAVACIVRVSTAIPLPHGAPRPARRSRLVTDWSLAGLSAKLACRSAARLHSSSVKEVRRLRMEIGESPRPSWRERLAVVVGARVSGRSDAHT